MKEINCFYDLQESVKESAQSYFDDNSAEIAEKIERHIDANEELRFFWEDEIEDAAQQIADNYVIYYRDSYDIFLACRFGSTESLEYLADAETAIDGCHDGTDFIDKYITSASYMIVERMAREYLSDLIQVKKRLATDTNKALDTITQIFNG